MPRNLVFLASLLAGLVVQGTGVRADDKPHSDSGQAGPAATLVLRNGHVVTMDDVRPTASAVAIVKDRIVAIGTDAEISRRIGNDTRVIDCAGRFVMPGFIEGHAHFVSLGESKLMLDLSTSKSWDEIVTQVAQTAKTTPKGQWIVGRGWHQGKWTQPPSANVDGYPMTADLSQAVPEHPVVLTHGTGHMALANSRAMELAGITAETKAPRGGEILRDRAGQPIGVFRETASAPLYRALDRSRRGRSAQEVRAELLAAIREAAKECLRFGITTFQDAGSPCSEVDLFRELASRGELPVRLWVMLNDSNDVLSERLPKYRTIGFGDNHLTVRAIKRMFDGALGTHGAWLLEPYDDLPTSRGLNTLPIDSLRRTAELALKHDFQLCVHAIGDQANRETLNAMEEAFRTHPNREHVSHGPVNKTPVSNVPAIKGNIGNVPHDKAHDRRDLRWRIEHAQHIHPADIPRFKQLGVIASMQGNHATSDGPFVVKRLGEWRARTGAYAWHSLLESAVIVINGTDAPVETLNPLDSFFSSVTRRMANGEDFFPEQRMTREQAVRSYTRDAAFAGFEEQLKGSLTPGKLADIVVLSQNLLTCSAESLRDAHVTHTIVGGKVLYEKK